MGRNAGDYKRLFERTKGYIASLNFVMLGYLFVDRSGWSWWYLLLIPILITLAYVDATYIHPKELQSGMNKNPDWVELKETIKRIESKLTRR